MAISKEDTARSYKGTVIGDNMVVSLNLKWLVQIITLCAMLVYSYYRIEMRIVELEDKFMNIAAEYKGLVSKDSFTNIAFDMWEAINGEEGSAFPVKGERELL